MSNLLLLGDLNSRNLVKLSGRTLLKETIPHLPAKSGKDYAKAEKMNGYQTRSQNISSKNISIPPLADLPYPFSFPNNTSNKLIS